MLTYQLAMKNSKEKNQQAFPRTKTRLEVAEEYGISRRTLRRKLKALNIQILSGKIAPADLKRIYQALGEPPYRKEEEKRWTLEGFYGGKVAGRG